MSNAVARQVKDVGQLSDKLIILYFDIVLTAGESTPSDQLASAIDPLKAFIRTRIAADAARKRKRLCDFTINELINLVRDAENLYYAEIPF